MNKKEKLKIVFDFIAEYLNEDNLDSTNKVKNKQIITEFDLNKSLSQDSFVEKLGLTVGKDGKVVGVSVKPMTNSRGEIEKHINSIKESD